MSNLLTTVLGFMVGCLAAGFVIGMILGWYRRKLTGG